MTDPEFKSPETIEEAESRRHALTLDVQSIQAQLGDKQRTDKSGNRLRSTEYNTWKKHATYNLNQKLAELRQVKAWIQQHRRELISANVEVERPPAINQALGHLQNLCSILEDLRGDEVDFDPDEAVKISAAQDFLRHLGIANTAKETT
jgi:hypothetical protein